MASKTTQLSCVFLLICVAALADPVRDTATTTIAAAATTSSPPASGEKTATNKTEETKEPESLINTGTTGTKSGSNRTGSREIVSSATDAQPKTQGSSASHEAPIGVSSNINNSLSSPIQNGPLNNKTLSMDKATASIKDPSNPSETAGNNKTLSTDKTTVTTKEPSIPSQTTGNNKTLSTDTETAPLKVTNDQNKNLTNKTTAPIKEVSTITKPVGENKTLQALTLPNKTPAIIESNEESKLVSPAPKEQTEINSDRQEATQPIKAETKAPPKIVEPQTDKVPTVEVEKTTSAILPQFAREDEIHVQPNDGQNGHEQLNVEGSTYKKKDEDEAEDIPSSGHFMSYFVTVMVIVVVGYLVYHNKQKVLAFILEGRAGRSSRRRKNGATYTKVKSDDVLPTLIEKEHPPNKDFIY